MHAIQIPESLRSPQSRRAQARQRRVDRRHRRLKRLYFPLTVAAVWATVIGVVVFAPNLSLVKSEDVSVTQVTLSSSAMSLPTYWEACSRANSPSHTRRCVYDALRIPGNPPAGQLHWGDRVKIPVYR